MTVIDDLTKKLKTAQRAQKVAREILETTEAEAVRLRREWKRRSDAVDELESAISLLRNGLKPKVSEIGAGNVTPLKRD